MMLVRKLGTILLIGLFALTTVGVSFAEEDPPIPGVPHAFWGTVSYESGASVSDGSIVLAVVDNENYTTMVTNGTYGYYTTFYVEDPGNDNHGLPISFYVDGIFSDQTVTFESGTTQLNLTISKNENDDSSDDSSQNTGGGGSMPPIESVAPDAVISARTYAFVNDSMVFEAIKSSDSDGEIVSYSWNFGDGSMGSGVTVSHTFNETGGYMVSLLVTDDEGLTDTDEISVSVMIDSDDDQWGDEEESEYGTDPENITDFPSDNDNDHIPDVNDSDDDNDGVIDSLEIILESDPLDDSDTISVHFNNNSGFLVDVNKDSVFDYYVDNDNDEYASVEVDEDGFYLLDIDFDGNIDYRYNVETGKILKCKQAFNLIYIVIIFVISIIVGLFVFYRVYISKKKDYSEDNE